MSDVSSVRLDTWLWAARFFKTRAVAAAAIDGGKVEVNGARAKRAKQLRVGDRLRVRKDPFQYELTVRGLVAPPASRPACTRRIRRRNGSASGLPSS